MTDKAIGSVHYIAPEQARGDLTDEKTDIYSVGVMLYEMLTGQLPFEADNAVSVAIMQLQSAPRPPREINPGIPEGLEEITLKAMQKNPEHRYQSAAEMLRDIETFRRDPSTRFQYKYFVDEKPTKYIDAINTVKNPDTPYYNDNYNYVEDNGEKPKHKKKNVAALIIAGIAAAFLIVALGIAAVAFYHNFNAGPADVTLPNFAGKSYNDVVKNYKNFKFVKEDKKDATHAAGTILGQKPQAGMTVKENSTVTLTVSTGGKLQLPDLSGKTQEDAEASLSQLNLKAKIVKVADDSVEAGLVVDTDPAAGSQVTEGSEISVYVSTGKAEEKVSVPDVTGETLENAKADITSAGLSVGKVTTKDDTGNSADIVLETDPLNGVKLAKGSSVNIVVSSGKSSQKSVNVYVSLPSGVSHDIVLKAYLDGDLQMTKAVNPSYNDVCPLSFTGSSGQHTLIVTLDGSKYNVFSIDFTAGTAKLTETDPYVNPSSESSEGTQEPSEEPSSSSSHSSSSKG